MTSATIARSRRAVCTASRQASSSADPDVLAASSPTNPANPASGVRPNGSNENIYQFVSEGVYRSNRLTSNVTLRTNRVTVFGYYMLRFNKSDAESNGVFPSNEYDLGADYGRSLDDVRHTATIGENARLPYGIETSGYLSAMSGAPFRSCGRKPSARNRGTGARSAKCTTRKTPIRRAWCSSPEMACGLSSVRPMVKP